MRNAFQFVEYPGKNSILFELQFSSDHIFWTPNRSPKMECKQVVLSLTTVYIKNSQNGNGKVYENLIFLICNITYIFIVLNLPPLINVKL